MKVLDDTMLTQKQFQALSEIRDRINEKFNIENMILYGSIVRGDFDEESDVDLLIITSDILPRRVRHEITDIVFDVNLKYETNYSTLVVDNSSWRNGPYSILPIHDEIEKEGVIYE
jgi:predicted nucleotidyltransferase